MRTLSVIDEIKQKIDIVEVVSRYVQLKKVGQNYRALCPFHAEKTPSFFVNPALGIFKCFGCQKGGDVIRFVQEIEHISFKEALEKLAKEAGVTIRFSKEENKLHKERKRLLNINKLLAEAFHRVFLYTKEAQKAREYVYKKRKLTKETVKEFKIGYAPASKEFIKDLAQKLKIGTKDLITLGFLSEDLKPKFFNRVMFPIFDLQKNIVGFTARTLSQRDDIAKYLNTPENLVFHKRMLLFGLSHNKQEISRDKLAILTEGTVDVITAYQKNLKNVVAPLGTSLTTMQVNLLKRFTQNIAFAFDNDEAGQKALVRAVALILTQDMVPYVIPIPQQYKDLDEYIRETDDASFLKEQKIEFFKYAFLRLKEYKSKEYAVFEEELDTLLNLIALANPIRQKLLLEQLAKEIEFDQSDIKHRFEKITTEKSLQETYQRLVSQAPTTSFKKTTDHSEKTETLIQTLLGLLVKFPSLVFELVEPKLLIDALSKFSPQKNYSTLFYGLLDFWKPHLKTLRTSDIKTLEDLHHFFESKLTEEFRGYLQKLQQKDQELEEILATVANLPYIAILDFNKKLAKDVKLINLRLLKQYITQELKSIAIKIDEAEQKEKKLTKKLNTKLRKLNKTLTKLGKIYNDLFKE